MFIFSCAQYAKTLKLALSILRRTMGPQLGDGGGGDEGESESEREG